MSENLKQKRKGRWLYVVLVTAIFLVSLHLVFSMAQINLEGKARAVRQNEIQTAEDGILKEFYVANAQKVRKGDLLFRFESQDLELDLLRAEGTLDELREKRIHLHEALQYTTKKLERANILFENGVISKAELEEITLENSQRETSLKELDLEIKTAQAALEPLKSKNNSLQIKAPFDGVFLGEIEQKRNTYFKQGEFLGILFDPSQFYLETFLPERDVLNVKTGDSAHVVFKGLRGICNGQVVQIDERITEEIEKVFKTKHVLRVLILLDESPKGLKPWMRGRAKITVSLSSK